MWFCGKQLPEKSRISKQLSKWLALCLFHSYPTRHGVEYFISRFSIRGRRILGMQVSKYKAIHITVTKTSILYRYFPTVIFHVYHNYHSQEWCISVIFHIKWQIEIPYFNLSYDYLKITDGKSHTFGIYCGEKTGESVVVAGDHVIITFYSDDIEQRRGFLIFFTAIPVGK